MLPPLLLWNKIGRVVTILSEELNIDAETALDLFYQSRTNELLHDDTTGMYLFGDRYLADEVLLELHSAAATGRQEQLP